MIEVKVWLVHNSVPQVYEVRAAYEKGRFYCLDLGDRVLKYPITHLWRVEEAYPETLRVSTGQVAIDTGEGQSTE